MVNATNNPIQEIIIDREILDYEMNSSKIYESEEKVTGTEMVKILLNAKECEFTA